MLMVPLLLLMADRWAGKRGNADKIRNIKIELLNKLQY
jgi:hypothetical protein